MKILSIIGTRPQLIKVFPIVEECKQKKITHVLVNTGQHYDYELDGAFIDEFGLPKPDYNLEVGSDSHAKQTGQILMKLEPVLIKEKPDFVLVYGDTNSSLAAALCAAKLGFKIGHVEAGPRGYDRTIPEEVNRVVVDHISDFLFAPTELSIKNLEQEGLKGIFVGNIMIETLLKCYPKVTDEFLKKYKLEKGKFVLATVHRAVNTDNKDRLEKIVNGFVESKVKIVLPLHPRTKKALEKYNLMGKLSGRNVLIMPPISFTEILSLEKYCTKIATDSGGVEYEGYVLNIPTLVLTDESDWKMTLDGSARIADLDKLAEELKKEEKLERKQPRKEDAEVSKKILENLRN